MNQPTCLDRFVLLMLAAFLRFLAAVWPGCCHAAQLVTAPWAGGRAGQRLVVTIAGRSWILGGAADAWHALPPRHRYLWTGRCRSSLTGWFRRRSLLRRNLS